MFRRHCFRLTLIIELLKQFLVLNAMIDKKKTETEQLLSDAPLGKKAGYIACYAPELLFPISRLGKREEIGIQETLPFKGFDVWNAFELSWLNRKGKPIVAVAQFLFPCESPNIIESKSFKLYLNSFNNTRFESFEAVHKTLQKDLTKAVGIDMAVYLHELNTFDNTVIESFDGILIDALDVACDTYHVKPEYLKIKSQDVVEETLVSHLLKSNCLVTGQPDWGSIQISYQGSKMDREGLLKYIVSFRNHNEFHEQCVERVFMDIMRFCSPVELTVYARYTRRGGLDINPIRSTKIINSMEIARNFRMARQ